MKTLLREFGYARLFAAAFAFLPLVLLPLLGAVWLWQSGYLLVWLSVLAGCGAAGYGLHWVAGRREAHRLSAARTGPDPNWSPSAEEAWEQVEARAQAATPEQWPLSDGAGLWRLGRDTLAQVAHHYHPHRERPLLELTVPHTLLIIERASHELRQQISTQIPLSHRLTLGNIVRLKQWKDKASRAETLYRLGYAALDPTSVVFREFRRDMGNRILGYGSTRVQTWLLQEYVRKVGFHAIELYSGRLLLDEPSDLQARTPVSDQALDEHARSSEALAREPLRVLLLGPGNAGRSSLVNALTGTLQAPVDSVAGTTTEVTAYPWQMEGAAEALLLDTPAIEVIDQGTLRGQIQSADLILWVSAANRADREQESQVLTRIREWLEEDRRRRPAPLLCTVTHIDRLRPLREWAPPYNLREPDSPKAHAIQQASMAVADDLAFAADSVVPVSLGGEAPYNVEDALMAVMLSHLDEAHRVRLLRCLSARQREENWTYLKRQLTHTGRLLGNLLDR